MDIKGLTVGYFPRNNAESWVKLLGRLNMPDNSEVYVKAVIVGGGSKDYSFGVRLDIPSRVANSAKYAKRSLGPCMKKITLLALVVGLVGCSSQPKISEEKNSKP